MTAITIPIDDETKRALDEICARAGWTIPDAVLDFFQKTIENDSPVIDEMNPMYREKNMEIIKKTIRQARDENFFRRAKPNRVPATAAVSKDGVSIDIDDETKRALDEICARANRDIPGAVRDFFQKAIHDDSPVIAAIDRFYCAANIKFLEESHRQLEEGKVIRVTMEELEALTEAMEALFV